MEVVGEDVKNAVLPIAGCASCLLDDERHWVAFIQKSKLAVWILLVVGIKKNAAFEQVAVKVGHERADISRRVGTPRRLIVFFEVIDIVFNRVVPFRGVSFVDAVNLPSRWYLDIRVG